MVNQQAIQSKLKRKALTLTLCLAAVLVHSTVSADTQIRITGTIKASPCKVDMPDGVVNVDLGQNIQASTLSEAGSSTEWKPFSIVLNDCPATTSVATMTLDGLPDKLESNMFTNTGSATQVQIEVQSNTGEPLHQGAQMTQNISDTRGAAFEMKARAYSAQGNATPGSIIGTLQATFTYQ